MELLTPQGYDPASQLVMHHLPSIVTLDNNAYRVAIGAEPHPMLPTHYVNFIYLEGEQSASIRFLKPEDKPSTVFCLPRDHPVAAYAYCNIHGLWRSDNLKPS